MTGKKIKTNPQANVLYGLRLSMTMTTIVITTANKSTRLTTEEMTLSNNPHIIIIRTLKQTYKKNPNL